MDDLRVVRRQKKAAITRHLGTLNRLVAEEVIDGVNDQLNRLQTSFLEFEASHDAFHSKLVKEEDIEESENWFLEVGNDYVLGVKEARAWLKLQQEVLERERTDVNQCSQSEMLSLLNIPKVELDQFSGNPLDYQSFIAVFDEVVDSKFKDCNVKLTRLLQYTTGEAKSSIKNCILIGGENGYKQARETLKNRFGNSHLVSQRIINDLKTDKRVVKAQEIQQLADELVMAVSALQKLGMYGELCSQQSIITIVRRCPQYVQNRWRRKALETKNEKDEYPSFEDFVSFMKLIASEACDPVYGSFSKRNEGSQTVLSSRSVFSTLPSSNIGSSTQRSCVVCDQNHRLFYCNTFKSLSPKSRFDVVVKNKLCFNCLLAGHNSRNCRKTSVCSVPGCGRKHTKFIHIENNSTDQPRSELNAVGEVLDGDMDVHGMNTSTNFPQVYLPIVPVVVNGKHEALALLDSGSDSSFVTQRLVKRANLTGREVSYRLNTLNESSVVNSKVVSFRLHSVDGGQIVNLNNVITACSIPARLPYCNIDLRKYDYLSDLPLQRVSEGCQVDILIGMDNAFALIPYEIRCNIEKRNQPYAVRTLFGWTINGPADVSPRFNVTSMCANLDKHIRDLWDMENFNDDLPTLSYEDSKVINLWNDEITLENGHYVLPIPWRNNKPVFPDNKYMATMRLKNLMNKLTKNETLDLYTENLMKMMRDGYAERVPVEDLKIHDGTVWYLPHHGIVSEAKPGKLRIVFDCAAKHCGVSLNNQCFQGPDLNNKLVHVLLRFRQYKYAIMADVEAMYHQVKIPVKDRNSLRFLWMENNSIVEYRMTSHLFGGVWCTSSSAFALRRSADDFSTSDFIRETIYKSFYVDDLLMSVKDSYDVKKIIVDTKQVLQSAGFKLTKFVINDAQLLQNVSTEDRAHEVKEITPDIKSKALGIRWDVVDDTFFCVSKYVEPQGTITKRAMLSQLSSLYDPLGLLSPIIIRGRMLFQTATRLKLSWDASLSNELGKRWSNWLISLKRVPEIKFKRCVIPDNFIQGAMELHTFSDASEMSYGACSYIRIVNEEGNIQVTLLASKVRLAPVKQITIPRLELSAAVIAAKLDTLIRRELDITLLKSTFWTDSQISLAYIYNDSRRFKTFVANRVAIIREHSDPEQWNHISGQENPADVLSRGCDVNSLPNTWINGPKFLHDYKSSWTVTPPVIHSLKDDVEMKRRDTHEKIQVYVNATLPEAKPHPLDILVDHFSCFYRLIKAICWLLRVKSYLSGNGIAIKNQVTVEEMKEAKTILIKHVQSQVYKVEIAALQQGNVVPKSSKLLGLSPMMKNGLLVIGGRLKYASALAESRNPIILPKNHRISFLIVRDIHNAAHLGIEWTLSYVRREYWIIQARSLIKNVKKNCITCKKMYGSTMYQKMSDLPPERCVSGNPPFSYVGVDLFGPFFVKQGRLEVKRYGCIFTCFNIRAIHMEVLNSLESDSFINGFMRFASRRGFPVKVWSDNGTNLVGARAELSQSLRQLDRAKVIQAARRKEVDWVFNPPLASHHGGIWERMIRTVRRILVSLIGRGGRMTDEILQTVFCEIENIVNSRPITKCSDDINDDVPLTPNHLLLQNANAPLPWGIFHDGDSYQKRWRQVQYISMQFWKRWTREYLKELQKRDKWQIERPGIRIGDLVLIMDESLPRGLWPLGIVTETNEGRDGLVRSVRVKTKTTQLVRPITKLVLLEGSC